MTAIPFPRSKTPARTEEQDLEQYGGFIRLYVLCRAGEGPISSRGMAQDLAGRGLRVGTRSLTQLIRGLERNGFVKSEAIGRNTVYAATLPGRFAIEQARRKLRGLFSATDANGVDRKDISIYNR